MADTKNLAVAMREAELQARYDHLVMCATLECFIRPVSYEAVGRKLGATDRPMLHFVRFKDDRYLNAVKTFGRPDFIHRFWDHRAVAEVMPGDTVIFAEGDEHQAVSPYTYDDSAYF